MRRAIKILIASSMFYNLAAGLLGPLWAVYVESIGGGVLGASGAWAVYTFFIGVLMLLTGRLEDKLNRRVMFVFGRFLNFVGMTGYLFVTDIYQLLIVQGILGASLAIMNPSFTAIYQKSIDRGRESSEWAYWEGTINIVLAFAAMVGGFIVTTFGFRVMFVFMSASSFVALLVALLLEKKKIRDDILLIEGKKVKKRKRK